MDLEIAKSNIIQFPSSMVKGSVGQPNFQGEHRTIGPIEQGMRAKLSQLKGCKYPDTFDWSVYDRIATLFPEPPRGVVFNTTFKLVNHLSTCNKCHYAFELDTYGRGCFHNCVYCYAKRQLTSHGYWNRQHPFPVNLAEVRKIFYTVFETDLPLKWRSIMEQKIPIRIGSDSFMYMDAKYGVTKELLKILKFYGYPYIIFTRSDLIAHEDYLELLSKDLCSVQFSISGNNQDFIRNIEPGAPSYRRRLKALEKLAKHGFWTTVRINPLFPRYPDGYFTDPDYIRGKFGSRESVPTLPFYDNQFIAELADARVPSVLAGVVRLSPWAINSMSRATGVDIRSFFRPEVTTSKGDKHFSDAENRHYHQWISNECRKHGLRFSTCYIRNGIKDYIQYQSIWSNKIRDCCDAIGNVTAFSKTSQQTPWDSGAKHTWRKEDALKQEAVDQHVQVE